jgi:hypothetical protein
MSWSEIKLWFGKLLNLAGVPAIVRECDYRSTALNVDVKVRRHGLYTIITVNGLDIFFTRFTGTMDGVGVNPASGYTTGAYSGKPESTNLEPQYAPPCFPEPPRNKTR